eukprot:753343-Hanusia_phi.AAC.1
MAYSPISQNPGSRDLTGQVNPLIKKGFDRAAAALALSLSTPRGCGMRQWSGPGPGGSCPGCNSCVTVAKSARPARPGPGPRRSPTGHGYYAMIVVTAGVRLGKLGPARPVAASPARRTRED